MRRIQIKVWPEIDLLYPAIINLERVAKNKENPLDIDLTNVYKVSSSGLTILLLNILKIGLELKNNDWDVNLPKEKKISEQIRYLNFYSFFLKTVPNQNLFWTSEKERNISNSPFTTEEGNEHKISNYPIYELDFNSNSTKKRETVEDFKNFLISELLYLLEKHSFDLSTFIQILVEMAKNSADHTQGNAYFGLDIEEAIHKIKIKFSFGDLGVGINQATRKFIRFDPTFKEKEKHLAITDAYHWALQIGNTTKPNSGINKGIGMSTIFNLSKQLNFRLSVFDAESRGLLSHAENITHVELRKVFYSLGLKVGFNYYGEAEILIL